MYHPSVDATANLVLAHPVEPDRPQTVCQPPDRCSPPTAPGERLPRLRAQRQESVSCEWRSLRAPFSGGTGTRTPNTSLQSSHDPISPYPQVLSFLLIASHHEDTSVSSIRWDELRRDASSVSPSAPGRIRTCDPRRRRPVPYPLDHRGVAGLRPDETVRGDRSRSIPGWTRTSTLYRRRVASSPLDHEDVGAADTAGAAYD